jgi:hypothetical protein
MAASSNYVAYIFTADDCAHCKNFEEEGRKASAIELMKRNNVKAVTKKFKSMKVAREILPKNNLNDALTALINNLWFPCVIIIDPETHDYMSKKDADKSLIYSRIAVFNGRYYPEYDQISTAASIEMRELRDENILPWIREFIARPRTPVVTKPPAAKSTTEPPKKGIKNAPGIEEPSESATRDRNPEEGDRVRQCGSSGIRIVPFRR